MSNSPSVDEAPHETAHSSGFPKHWIVLGLLVLAHAVFGAYVTPTDKTLAALAVGVAISQPVLLATWAAFARQRLYHRLLWSLSFCTYLSFADDLGTIDHFLPNWWCVRGDDPWSGPIDFLRTGELIVMNMTLFVVALVVLLSFRCLFRWQITRQDVKGNPSVYLASQFGVHHLLTLTAIVALACGLVRSLIILTNSERPFSSVDEFIGSLCLLLVTILPTVVVPWITLAYGRKRFFLILIAIPVVGALDFYSCSVLAKIVNLVYLSLVDMSVPFVWIQQLGAILSAVISTLVLRFCGFRMIREPKMQA